jgi:Rrf2 family transcriptional regulator, iron-sulfur cluster assembly transcription factor
MKLTTKGRFAVTAMIDLALHEAHQPVVLADISQRQNISLSYLGQLFNKLRRYGIVKSVRGPGGGYRLKSCAEHITVAHIILAVDEPIDTTRCGGKGGCDGVGHEKGHCMTHDLWMQLNQKMHEYLDSVSLQDLVIHARTRKNHTTMTPDNPTQPLLATAYTREKGQAVNTVHNIDLWRL